MIKLGKINNREIFENPVKMRIPIGKPGHAFMSLKDKKVRGKITVDNWEKF